MRKRWLLLLGFCGTAFAGEEPFGPINVDGGHITCKSPSGDEIKKTQMFHAPSDRFFKESSIAVTKISGWGPEKNGCDLVGVKKKPVKLNSDAGVVEVEVVTEFGVYAYADCGTNIAKYMGKTASIECQASATMVEFKK
jgi:hypothetical protein